MNTSEQAASLARIQNITAHPSAWVVVPGYSSYAVHPNGLVFSGRQTRPAFLMGTTAGRGYRAVQMKSDTGALDRIYIHRLIASVFLPVDPQRPQINHKDGDKRNNAVSNLEWCTAAENLAHARRTGLSRLSGIDNPGARYSTTQVDRIRQLRREGNTYASIAKAVGCSVMQANRIARGLLRKDG